MNNTTNEPRAPLVLQGPYVSLADDNEARLNATISKADWIKLRTICPLHGTFNYIIGTLIKHLVNELERRNITSYDPEAVTAIIAEMVSGSDHRTSGHSSAPDDSGRASGVPPASPLNESESPDDGSTAPGGVRRAGQQPRKPKAPHQKG